MWTHQTRKPRKCAAFCFSELNDWPKRSDQSSQKGDSNKSYKSQRGTEAKRQKDRSGCGWGWATHVFSQSGHVTV
ncbi:hypothetical protein EMIT0P294_20734 [Pseudomonas sp. IT-P294]